MAPKRTSPVAPEREALAGRLRALVEAIGTQAEAAGVAQVSERQLRMYLAGDSSPPFLVVARLAAAANADLNWVMSGAGSMKRATESAAPAPQAETDARLLGRLVDALGRVYDTEGVALPRHDLGELAAAEYDRIVAATDDEDERAAMVKLVAEKHRHSLRSESFSSRKRGA